MRVAIKRCRMLLCRVVGVSELMIQCNMKSSNSSAPLADGNGGRRNGVAAAAAADEAAADEAAADEAAAAAAAAAAGAGTASCGMPKEGLTSKNAVSRCSGVGGGAMDGSSSSAVRSCVST